MLNSLAVVKKRVIQDTNFLDLLEHEWKMVQSMITGQKANQDKCVELTLQSVSGLLKESFQFDIAAVQKQKKEGKDPSLIKDCV